MAELTKRVDRTPDMCGHVQEWQIMKGKGGRVLLELVLDQEDGATRIHRLRLERDDAHELAEGLRLMLGTIRLDG